MPASPGKSHREGVALIELFPDEDAAAARFESALRQRAHPGGSECPDDALPVHGLPVLLLGSRRHAVSAVQRSAPQVGDCHLPLPDQPEVRVLNEAAPRYRRPADYRVVHASPDPRVVGGRRRRTVGRPHRGR